MEECLLTGKTEEGTVSKWKSQTINKNIEKIQRFPEKCYGNAPDLLHVFDTFMYYGN